MNVRLRAWGGAGSLTGLLVSGLAWHLASGCGGPGTEELPSARPGARTIVDAAGRTVLLPERVQRVVSPFAMYTRLILALGGCDQLVGISHNCILHEESFACGGRVLDLPDVGPFGHNVELIASLRPDLIFAAIGDARTFEQKTGSTVVAVSFPQDTPLEEMFYEQIGIIGRALGREAEARDLRAFVRRKLHRVTDITSAIPDSLRPTAYFGWTSWTGDITNSVVDFQPIELAGGINLARDCGHFAKGERGILVSREHIINWNPDFIFLSRYRAERARPGQEAVPVTIEDVLADPLYQSVSAVRSRNVYYTTAFCNWWPHQRALAQVLYMAKLFHPDEFPDLDVEKEGNEIFARFYGVDGLYTDLARALELHHWD